MDVAATPAEMRAWRAARPAAGVGLVPTMGYLHEGHLSLVRASREANALTAVSIFVNPAQFGPGEDFERYPRDEERDLALLRDAGVDVVYMPSAADIYPPGYQTYVTVEAVSRGLEGERRPGHFRGVATVVLKLFNAVRPDRAYFGRKDAQQLRVIQAMVRDLDLPLDVVPCEIVREPDGLAMSSRNVYLSPEQRAAAPVLYRGLCAARAAWSGGKRDADTLRAAARAPIAREPLAGIDYVSLVDDETLHELTGTVAGPALLSLAVRFGATRLIDNVELR
jgi:pantoate--beta-alanine ligase